MDGSLRASGQWSCSYKRTRLGSNSHHINAETLRGSTDKSENKSPCKAVGTKVLWWTLLCSQLLPLFVTKTPSFDIKASSRRPAQSSLAWPKQRPSHYICHPYGCQRWLQQGTTVPAVISTRMFAADPLGPVIWRGGASVPHTQSSTSQTYWLYWYLESTSTSCFSNHFWKLFCSMGGALFCWKSVLGLQRCSGRFMEHLLADGCIVTRWEIYFSGPVSSFNAVAWT